jgi:hypothetical protein
LKNYIDEYLSALNIKAIVSVITLMLNTDELSGYEVQRKVAVAERISLLQSVDMVKDGTSGSSFFLHFF